MQDAHGKPIEPGQTLRRVVDGRALDKGSEYQVIQYDWDTGDEEGSDLVAHAGFVRELLDSERAKEFEVLG